MPAPDFPPYQGYDGPRDTKRLNYAADVISMLSDWVGGAWRRDMYEFADFLRERAEENFDEEWPK